MPEDYDVPRLPASEWLSGFDERYLADYVVSGGSVVRFVSGDDAVVNSVRAGLERIARERNYHFRFLDSGVPGPDGKPPQYHTISRLYGAVTEGVDWQGWAREQARRVLDDLGIRVPAGCDLGDIETIAAANGADRDTLIKQYTEQARRRVQDYAMTVEFRNAVTSLWADQLHPDTTTPGLGEVLTAWLSGRTMPPGGSSVLRRCQIYGRIGPTNARHYLVSFCEWTRRVGRSGVLLALDFRGYERVGGARTLAADALAAVKAAIEEGKSVREIEQIVAAMGSESSSVRHSKRAYEQMLSLLRRFIDEIDRFPSLALVVMASPRYFGPEAPRVRTYRDYNALQTRIGDEVRDRRRANPDAALVHLKGDLP